MKFGKETLLHNTIKFLELYGINEVVINVHYLSEQIIHYVNKRKFNLKINIIKEDELLDTGGGVLNAIDYFSNEPFMIINPDTIWNKNYLKEVKLVENFFLKKNNAKCTLLIVNKKKSFDKLFKGDFNLDKNLVKRIDKKNLNFVYTGLQIIKPEVFSHIDKISFSMNLIWDMLIEKKELYGVESNIDFLHVSSLDIYKDLVKKI